MAFDQARADGDIDGQAASSLDLSIAYLGLGELARAEYHLDLAVDLAEKTGLSALATSALDNLGTLHAARRDEGDLAAASYRRAIELAEAEDNPVLAFNALTNLARLDLDEDRRPDALAQLERAKTHLARFRGNAGKIDDILLLGRLWARAGDIEAAYGALTDGRERAGKAGQPRLEALAAGYLGDLYASSKRNNDAIVLYDQATFLAQAAEAPELVYRWQWKTGQLLA